MIQPSPSPVVHLELHTANLARACGFYSRCGVLEQVEVGDRSYQAFDWGGGLEGGVVGIDEATECARHFGASVLLEQREGAHPRTAPRFFYGRISSRPNGSHLPSAADGPTPTSRR